MSAAQLSELRRADAVASRPVLLSIDRVGFSVRSGNGKLVILEDLSLQVREGEFVSIIGGSGCGKTTLLRLIGGLNLPTSGTITFDGAPATGKRVGPITCIDAITSGAYAAYLFSHGSMRTAFTRRSCMRSTIATFCNRGSRPHPRLPKVLLSPHIRRR